jgi:hypothetical protein
MIIKLGNTLDNEELRTEIVQWAADNGIPALDAAVPVFVDTEARRVHWCHVVTTNDGVLGSIHANALGQYGLHADGPLIGDEHPPRLVLMRDTPLMVDLPTSAMAGV